MMTNSEPPDYAAAGSPKLDASLTRRLWVVAARLRRYVLVDGAARVLALLFVSVLIQFVLDFTTHGLRGTMRAALLGLILGGTAAMIWRRVVQPWRVRVGPAEVARLVERRYPELSAVLISAVRFSSGSVGDPRINSPALVHSVVHRAADRCRHLDFNAVLNPRRARWSALTVVAILALSSASAYVAPDHAGLWFARNVLLKDVPWPKRTRLVVDAVDGQLFGARGDDLVIQAWAEGEQPREVEITYETASGERGRDTMVTVGSRAAYRYRFTFKSAEEDFDFRLRGGDDRTPLFHVRLVDRPRVDWSEMRIMPPGYAGIEPYTLGGAERTTEVLPGSTVQLRIKTNKPVVRATLKAGSESIAEASLDGDQYVVAFTTTESHTYHFDLVDDAGLNNRKPVSFSLRVVEDEPPHVRLKVPGIGDMITPDAILPIEVEASDAYGLAGVELIFQISGESERSGSIALPDFHRGLTAYSTGVNWKIAVEGVQTGERLTLLSAATDFNPVDNQGAARSPEVIVRVVTRDELLAEMARREREHRMDFERLVDAQEQLRGRLLTVEARFASGGPQDELAETLAPLERRQRNVARSVNGVRQQFEQILTELAINQLDSSDVRERIAEGIIAPLNRLAKRELITAADLLRQWAREPSPDRASLVDPQQVVVLTEMHAVLARMIQWEGYHELVDMLRDIIRLQDELNTETKDLLVREAGELFND